MGEARRPEEIQDSMVRAMGPEIGKLYYELWNDLAWTYARWDEYIALFGSGEQHLHWMNTVAPRCFYQIQTAMRRDILLQICCLSNCPKTSGKTNTSVQALDELLDEDSLGARYSALVASALSQCRFACEGRDRACADRDLPTAREHHTVPLDPAKRDNVEAALAAVADVLNFIEMHYVGSRTSFEDSRRWGDVAGLLGALESEAERIEA